MTSITYSSLDFGESIVPVTGADAFFLDTNIIVAYLYDKHEKHFPCFNFITYLIKNDVTLCTSEIVIVELLNTLARIYYIDDEYQKWIVANGEPATSKERKGIEFRIKNSWSGSVIKDKPEVLKHYNSLAAKKIKPFIQGALVIEISDEIIVEALDLVTNTPLASADAMIVSTSTVFGCHCIVSIDKDMSVSGASVLTSEKKNDNYACERMLVDLDLIDYLIDKLGADRFKEKFPNIAH